MLFKDLEAEIDKQLEELKIWSLPFQTVISNLLLLVESLDQKSERDTAMDFMSRISYIYRPIREKSAASEVANTTTALQMHAFAEYVDDLNFLMAYAHYAMLMPQFHKKTFTVIKESDNSFEIAFTDTETTDAEIIDRIYSYLSQQAVLDFKLPEDCRVYIDKKVQNNDNVLDYPAFQWIQHFYEHYLRYQIAVQVVPDDTLIAEVGISFEQYKSFSAAVRAWCRFFLELGRAYRRRIGATNDEIANANAAEFLEWAVCCLNAKVIFGFIMSTCGLNVKQFKQAVSYFLTKISDNTNEQISENAVCGDGYFPPFILLDDMLVFGSAGTGYMLPINNLLYSLNKSNPKQFAEKISSVLEPVLIGQIKYLFSFFPEIRIATNINYSGGEIDVIILSEKEKLAICMQVKATIAPDSARTVRNVESRATEGMDQIRRFTMLSDGAKLAIVNKEFKTQFECIDFTNMLCVRSSSGTTTAWKENNQYPIVNYVVLAYVLANKREVHDLSMLNFRESIYATQATLKNAAHPVIVKETIQLGDNSIVFPNVNMDNSFIMSVHSKVIQYFPDYENVHS